MPYSITVDDVLDGFQTSASKVDVAAYIAVVDQADACLTNRGVGVVIGKHMKILGARHLATNANDRGPVTQERAVSGASRTYGSRAPGETGHLETLRTIDQHGCVMATLSRNARVQLRSVGRRAS